MSYTHADGHRHTNMPTEYIGIRKCATLSPETEEVRERDFYVTVFHYTDNLWAVLVSI